jgi:hypothetical protein
MHVPDHHIPDIPFAVSENYGWMNLLTSGIVRLLQDVATANSTGRGVVARL